ncbi:MAG: nuclear transport factor 2 family protein [Actinomycetota bacterium]
MQGFDPAFENPTAYILGITKEIWEDRGIDTLHRYYAPKIGVRSPDGVVVGNTGVIAATMATLAEFPDRQLLGEDVIWCDDGNGGDGFLSSHRILSMATHAGHGAFGPPSGTRFVYRIIADCAARENQIYDEWLIRDLGAIVRQLGVDPERFAAQQIEAEGGPEAARRPFTPADDVPAVYTGTGNDAEPGATYAGLLGSIMGADLAAVERGYDRAVQLELPGGVTAHGRPAADRFWLGLRSSFPNAEFEVHHRIGRNDDGLPPRAALRWSLHGRHEGWGAFGQPTGAEVHVMGLSHAEFGPRGLRREFVLYDEIAVWKQIHLHRG